MDEKETLNQISLTQWHNPSNIFALTIGLNMHVTKYSPAKTGEYPIIFPIFKTARVAKKI